MKKFSLGCLFLFFIIANANAYSQPVILLNVKKTSIKKVFESIEKQTDYVFIFTGDLNKELEKKIDVDIKSSSIEDVMNKVLENASLKYRMLDRQIAIYKANTPPINKKEPEPGPTPVLIPRKDPITITGTVTNSKGEALAGTSISIKGSNKGFFADENGAFKFSLDADKEWTLVFTQVGYKPVEVTVKNSQDLKIVMEDMENQVQEIVITGFGNKAKNSYTGSQTTITRNQLMSAGTKSVIASIEAFAPGMRIVPDNAVGSDPNAKPQINIRGRSSFEGAANIPVFVVDGVQVPLDYVFDMDVNDIETVTVLKDATATALYGSKGSAGVIVITTKVLSSGKLKFNYDVTMRASVPDLSDYHLLDSKKKLEYERLAGLYTDPGRQYYLDNLYNQRFQTALSGVNTDWMSKPLQNGLSQNHNFGINGGDGNIRYYLGVRYGKEEGVMKGSNRDRLSSTYKFSYNSIKNLVISNSSTVSWIKSKESPYGSFSQYTRLNPYDRPTDANGEFVKELSYQMHNPVYEASIGNYKNGEQFYFMNITDLQLWLKKDLRLDGMFSFRKEKNDSRNFVSPLSKDEDKKQDASLRGYLTEANTKLFNYTGRLMLSYNRYFANKLFLSTTGGANIEGKQSDGSLYKSIGFYSDKLAHPAFANRYPISDIPGGSELIDRSVGFFVTANLIQNNKYFLDANYRYEGSSKFGKNARFAPFWSIGAGWNIHNESFINNVDVQVLKLRASIGYTGNQSFSPYQAMTTYAYSSVLNYTKGQGAVPLAIGNPDLKWERNFGKNIGLDVTLFNRRLDFVLDMYEKNTDNLLLDVYKPPSIGATTITQNIGKIQNRGIELQTRVVPIDNKDWHWALSLNYSYNRNRIKNISDALKKQNEINNKSGGVAPLPNYEEGQSLSAIKVVPSAGIDPATGKEIFIKQNGEYTFVYDANDKVVFGEEAPNAYGKLSSYLMYKKFSVNCMFGYSMGGAIYNTTLASRVEGANPMYNADTRVFDSRWKQAGDIAAYKNIADYTTPLQTSRFVQINNYFTLQSLSLGYDFDLKQLRNLRLKRLRLEALTNDLFYITSVRRERGLDYPFARSFELSLRVSF